MELLGEVVINAPRDTVWAALNDAQILKACIPGCESLTDDSPDTRRATVMIKMGPVRARFQGRVMLSDMQAPQSCTMSFDGSGGAAGMASGNAKVTLACLGPDGLESVSGSATRLNYSVTASVGGKLGQIGGRLIDASAKQLAGQFFAALRGQLEPVAVAPDVVPSPPQDEAVQAAPLQPARVDAPIRTANNPLPAPHPLNAEFSRILWFVMGAASTGFGVWLGAWLLH
jgi:uncharacterized protein